MNELTIRNTADVGQHVPTIAPEMVPSTGTMRLVEWAQEAQAANHLAKALCHTPFAGSWKGDENGATAAILKGAEVGLTPVTALGAFDNIQGQPAPKAITLRALVQSHGHDLEIIEESDARAVARYRRNGRGDWLTTEFTMDHARMMRLEKKDNWIKQPGAMLVARVTSKAARLVASDVILGIGYSSEELHDQNDGGPASVSAVPATAPAATRMQGILHREDEPPVAPPEEITAAQLKKLHTVLTKLGLERDEALAFYHSATGREVDSSKALTKDEAHVVIDTLEAQEPAP